MPNNSQSPGLNSVDEINVPKRPNGKGTAMKKKVLFFAAVSFVLMLLPMHADTIILDSGKAIKGEIIEETDETVLVKLASGVTTEINRDEIVEIKREEDLEKEYKKRLKKILPGDIVTMMDLADWCRRRGLKKHQRELLQRVLQLCPDDAEARKELDKLEGKLTGRAREEKSGSDGITFKPGQGLRKKKPARSHSKKKEEEEAKSQPEKKEEPPGQDIQKLKKPRDIRRLWDDEVEKKVKCRSSKYKPKKTTEAAFKGLDYILEHGFKIRYAVAGQVITASLAGMAALSSRDNKYAKLFHDCVKYVKYRLKMFTTGNRTPVIKGDQCNWLLTIGGIFLAEASVHYQTPEHKKFLQKVADQLIINMEESGGYGHDISGPWPGYIEMEVMSNFAVACLGMCKRAGCSVPKDKLAKAIAYIEKCSGGGGVAYSHTNPARDGSPGRCGGAVFALAMAGAKNSRKYSGLAGGLDRIMNRVKDAHGSPALSFVQCALGSLQVGRRTWDNYVATWFKYIIKHQNEDGSFKPIGDENDLGFEKRMGATFFTAAYSCILLLDRGNLKYAGGCSRAKK